MKQIERIKEYAGMLRLGYLSKHASDLLHQATIDSPSYNELVELLLTKEIAQRQQNDYQRRIKLARLPRFHELDAYDFKTASSIGVKQMKQLRELLWVDQLFNLVLMGPSGTGKTFIAGGLIHDAVKRGYKAYFSTMADLIAVINQKEVITTAMNTYKRYLKADLIAIDDIMMFPVKKHEAVGLFDLINHLHEQCSLIITTNKSPMQWAQTLDDEVLATAILDRILFHCEVVKLEGSGYRMDHRKTFLDKNEN